MQTHSGTDAVRRGGLTLLAGLVGSVGAAAIVIGLFFALLIFVLRSPLDIRASDRSGPALALRATLPLPQPPIAPAIVAEPAPPAAAEPAIPAPVQRAELSPIVPEVPPVAETKPEPDTPIVVPPAQMAAVTPEPRRSAPSPGPEPAVTGATPPAGVGGPFVPAPPQAAPDQIVQLAAMPRPKPEPKTKKTKRTRAKATAPKAAKQAAKPARKAERSRGAARAKAAASSASGNGFDTFNFGNDTSATRNPRATRRNTTPQRALGSDDFGRISSGN